MQLPLQITVRNIAVGTDVIGAIRAYAEKLNAFYDRIVACRVLVEVSQRHRIGTPLAYGVRLDVTVPGGELVIKRKSRVDVLTAAQDAFDAAERRLKDYASRQRGEVKRHAAP